MLVQYYENRLIVVGITWSQYRGQYIYSLTKEESDYLYTHFDETELIKNWCIQHAGDFMDVEDFQLEVREKTKLFDNEDSWLIN